MACRLLETRKVPSIRIRQSSTPLLSLLAAVGMEDIWCDCRSWTCFSFHVADFHVHFSMWNLPENRARAACLLMWVDAFILKAPSSAISDAWSGRIGYPRAYKNFHCGNAIISRSIVIASPVSAFECASILALRKMGILTFWIERQITWPALHASQANRLPLKM